MISQSFEIINDWPKTMWICKQYISQSNQKAKGRFYFRLEAFPITSLCIFMEGWKERTPITWWWHPYTFQLPNPFAKLWLTWNYCRRLLTKVSCVCTELETMWFGSKLIATRPWLHKYLSLTTSFTLKMLCCSRTLFIQYAIFLIRLSQSSFCECIITLQLAIVILFAIANLHSYICMPD